MIFLTKLERHSLLYFSFICFTKNSLYAPRLFYRALYRLTYLSIYFPTCSLPASLSAALSASSSATLLILRLLSACSTKNSLLFPLTWLRLLPPARCRAICLLLCHFISCFVKSFSRTQNATCENVKNLSARLQPALSRLSYLLVKR